jgi:hypothetical protein
MRRRKASVNDVAIAPEDRKFLCVLFGAGIAFGIASLMIPWPWGTLK